jgi:hypothetical protein
VTRPARADKELKEECIKDKRTDETKNTPGNLNRFEPGRELGPIDDRNEYEQRIDTLAADQRELAQESTRLADLCQYFSTQKIDTPPQLVERISSLRGWRPRSAFES